MTVNRHFYNSEGEKIEIREVGNGFFAGQHCLIIHDDPQSGGTEAPMLLDAETQGWLVGCIDELRSATLPHTEDPASVSSAEKQAE